MPDRQTARTRSDVMTSAGTAWSLCISLSPTDRLAHVIMIGTTVASAVQGLSLNITNRAIITITLTFRSLNLRNVSVIVVPLRVDS